MEADANVHDRGAQAAAGDDDAPSTSSPSFAWDAHSHLYYHAGSGFYHDPAAGWYYSSWDGVYYRFQDGSYVPLVDDDPCPIADSSVHGAGSGGESCVAGDDRHQSVRGESCQEVDADAGVCDGAEDVRPPSEWLEETLIDLYLKGHSRSDADEHGDSSVRLQNDPLNDCLDEEKWKAQFGQIINSQDEDALNIPITDLWDWSLVSESEKHQEVKLMGRLVGHSKKLHPSLSAVGFLKTAKIREIHLNLVRVGTGKIYRLRSPSLGYLSSLSVYDASNPTKDWDFPAIDFSSIRKLNASENSTVVQHNGAADKIISTDYRDRAAKRRALHGHHGIGLGEKRQRDYELGETEFLSEVEAFNMSCGPGSYSRQILENMGWKEGEALGRRKEGILEPLQAIGNRGNLGLGWSCTQEI